MGGQSAGVVAALDTAGVARPTTEMPCNGGSSAQGRCAMRAVGYKRDVVWLAAHVSQTSGGKRGERAV